MPVPPPPNDTTNAPPGESAGGDSGDPGAFVGHARTVAGLTLVSRISGLARDAICSRVFGTSAVWSAFVTAFIIPNLFRRLFGEGALSAAFIPRYTTLLESNDDPRRASDAFASLTVWLLAGVLGGVTIIAELALLAALLLGGGAEGMAEPTRDLIVLAMLMLPYMPLVCITAILGGMLQVRGRFAPHAAAPVLLNVAMAGAAIIGALVFESLTGAASLVAISVVLAGGLQIVWCVRRLRGLIRWRLAAWDAWTQVRAMLLAMGPVIVGMGALQLSSLVDAMIAGYPLAVGPMIGWGERAIAYPLDEASAAVLYFAQRLYQFPLGVFGIAIATAVFPALARAGARLGEERHQAVGTGQREEQGVAVCDGGALYVSTLREGIRLSLFIAWPATLGLIVVREPLTAVLYAGGDFAADDVARVSSVLVGYALAVWAYGLTHVFTRAFYALGDMKTPMKAGLASVLANIALNLVLIWPLREAGLAWSTAICAGGQALALAWLLRRRVLGLPGASGRLLDPQSARSVALTIVAGLGMFAILLGVDVLALERLLPEATIWTAHASRLGMLTLTGAGLYAAMAAAFHLPELGWVLRTLGIRRSHRTGSPDDR